MNHPTLAEKPLTPASRLSRLLNAASYALQFFLIAAAFFVLLIFGLFGLAVALRTGLGPDAVPILLWGVALIPLITLSIVHGVSKAREDNQ